MEESIRLGEIIAEKYRVDRVLGRGAMGTVVAATHLKLQKVRAIKVMHRHALRSNGAAEYFLREAWTACALDGEHVARVLDVGEHDGLPFIVMEYLEGSDLGEVLDQRRVLPVREATLYALQLCEALAEAHAFGIVHRDIKPANLMLTRRRDGTAMIKVLDFGLAKAVMHGAGELSAQRSSSGILVGSPYYMSPEQVRSQRDIDARSDIWAVGVLLYRMLTSHLPFRPPNRFAVLPLLAAIAEATPEPPTQLVGGIPSGLEAVILRCLEKDRERRYANVAELASALSPFAPVDAALHVVRIRRVLRGGARPPAGVEALRLSPVSDLPLPPVLATRPAEAHLPSGAADETVLVGGADSGTGPGTLTAAAWDGVRPSPPAVVATPRRRPRAFVAASAAGLMSLLAVAGGIQARQRAQAVVSSQLEARIAPAVEALFSSAHVRTAESTANASEARPVTTAKRATAYSY